MFAKLKQFFKNRPVDDYEISNEFRNRFTPYHTTHKLERIASGRYATGAGHAVGYELVRHDLSSTKDVRDEALYRKLKKQYLYGVVITVYSDETMRTVLGSYLFFIDEKKNFVRTSSEYDYAKRNSMYRYIGGMFNKDLRVWLSGINCYPIAYYRNWVQYPVWRAWIRRKITELEMACD